MSDYSLMQTTPPYKSYVKRCLGKLYVQVLDPFPPGEPTGVILHGNPRKPTPECIVDVWSERENMYFLRANKKHFDSGDLGEYTYKPEKESETDRINRMTDSELQELLSTPFFGLKATVDKFTAVTPLFVLLQLAKESEKSEKIIRLIEAKIAELQEEELPKIPEK